MMIETNFELFTLADISRKSGMAHSTVWEHYRRGKLPAPVSKKGRVILWDTKGYALSIQYFKTRNLYERLGNKRVK